MPRLKQRNFPFSLKTTTSGQQVNITTNDAFNFDKNTDFTIITWARGVNSAVKRRTTTGYTFNPYSVSGDINSYGWDLFVNNGANSNYRTVKTWGGWTCGIGMLSAGVRSIMVNGVIETCSGTADLSAGGSFATPGEQLSIAVGASSRIARQGETLIYARALTLQERQDYYFNGIIPATPLLHIPATEGAGTTVNDISGNGYNGTFSGSVTWDGDTAMKKRIPIDGNILGNNNVDLSLAPPFVAATSTTGVWIDGTAAGSSSNDLFGWGTNSYTGTFSAQFDDGAIKVHTEPGGTVEISQFSGSRSITKLTKYCPVLKPNTNYLLSYSMKTEYISGDSISGACISANPTNVAGNVIATTPGTRVKTTTVWTPYTITFSTDANVISFHLKINVNASGSTADLSMNAWFKNIKLTEATPAVRVQASGRVAV